MSTKFSGIGLLAAAGIVAGGAGAFVAMRPDVPAPVEVSAAPVPSQSADATDSTAGANPSNAPEVAAPVSRPAVSQTSPRPVVKTPVRTLVTGSGTPVRVKAPVHPPDADATAVAAPIPSQVISEPPAASPTPAASETPRYVADSPATSVAPTDPPRIQFEELTVAKHSVIGIRLDAPVSTRTARLEDRVSATVSRDVTVAGRTAIAAGTRLEGNVVLVERGGRFRNRPRLGLQFDRMILADGTRVNIKTDTIYREGDSPTPDATAKVGTGAVAGAILGAVIGG
ncbi:MAG: hypothetical protein ABIP90_07800, partial [Vicinamibacterales bacterium]